MGVDPKTILATSHGRRSIDMMKIYDPSKANWECEFQPRGYLAYFLRRSNCHVHTDQHQMSTTSKAVSPRSTGQTRLKSPAHDNCSPSWRSPARAGESSRQAHVRWLTAGWTCSN